MPNLVSIQGGDGHWVGSCCETHRLAMVRVLDHAGALLIGGASFAQEVIDRLGTPAPERFTIVPGAVDTERFTPGARGTGPLRLLYHGRVDRRKGVLDFLEALPTVRGDWRATISGIGPDLQPAQELARTLGLDERVHFSGYADYADVPALYRQHDVFVSPTYAEGFSNTILEAMASGLAVVSCRSVGVVDCIRDGENGLLVEPGDRAGLAEALSRMITHAALRDTLSKAGLAECRATYSWSAVGRQIMGVYAGLIGTKPDTDFSPELPRTPCRFRAEPHLL